MTPDAPYAIVEHDSPAQRGLLALGWEVTDMKDAKDGWDHMEPPHDHPVIVQAGSATRLDLRDGDALVVTAEGLESDGVSELQEQVYALLDGQQEAIVANFEIDVKVIGRAERPLEPLFKHRAIATITSVGGDWVEATVAGFNDARWPALGFVDALPEVGECLLVTTELRQP